jgi:hypothetical protein
MASSLLSFCFRHMSNFAWVVELRCIVCCSSRSRLKSVSNWRFSFWHFSSSVLHSPTLPLAFVSSSSFSWTNILLCRSLATIYIY